MTENIHELTTFQTMLLAIKWPFTPRMGACVCPRIYARVVGMPLNARIMTSHPARAFQWTWKENKSTTGIIVSSILLICAIFSRCNRAWNKILSESGQLTAVQLKLTAEGREKVWFHIHVTTALLKSIFHDIFLTSCAGYTYSITAASSDKWHTDTAAEVFARNTARIVHTSDTYKTATRAYKQRATRCYT